MIAWLEVHIKEMEQIETLEQTLFELSSEITVINTDCRTCPSCVLKNLHQKEKDTRETVEKLQVLEESGARVGQDDDRMGGAVGMMVRRERREPAKERRERNVRLDLSCHTRACSDAMSPFAAYYPVLKSM
jgi:hypothetical protein